MTAFIFVIGFELSGIGKGTIASSLGMLLKSYGIRVTALKIDPYLNIDPGTISPHEHGEVYVLSDGSECDLDLGNYERFLDVDLSRENSITTGQIYREVIQRERDGKYLGKTVQIVPHITDHIEERILRVTDILDKDGNCPDVVIVELGGTVGDMESDPYLYAISQFHRRTGAPVCIIGIGLLINNNGEQKTKPLQHAVKDLSRHAISPDILCVRCDMITCDFPLSLREKIAVNCHVSCDSIIVSGRVRSIYEVPKILYEQKMHEHVCRKLGLLQRLALSQLENYNKILIHLEQAPTLPTVRVAIIAKYIGTPDAYLSLVRALEHASFALGLQLKYDFIDASKLEQPVDLSLQYDHILVPGGFGARGIEGKMEAIRQARYKKLPFLGICLGMQLFVIDHCRTVLGQTDANSTEFDPQTVNPVVRHLDTYGEEIIKQLGGTMRLGAQVTTVQRDSLAGVAYARGTVSTGPSEARGTVSTGPSEARGTVSTGPSEARGTTIVEPSEARGLDDTFTIIERHRHRYEVSTTSIAGLRFSGWSTIYGIPDIVETTEKNWWAVGCQYHPEFISRNERPHPLFVAFLRASQN